MENTHKLTIAVAFIFCIHSVSSQRVPYVHPPVPGLPALFDPITVRSTTAPLNMTGPQYLDMYLPSVMQALAYYVELLQYEPVDTTTFEPPLNGENKITSTASNAATKPSLKPPRKTTVLTPKPLTTIWGTDPSTTEKYSTLATSMASTTPTPKPTPHHKPGYYAPLQQSVDRPFSSSTWRPPTLFTTRTSTLGTHSAAWSSVSKPTHKTPPPTKPTVNHDKNSEMLDTIDSDKDNFLNWLFQSKAKQLQPDQVIDNDLQRLDPLPGGLVKDIAHENYHLPAIRDDDNVNEFLRLYDDHFGRYRPISGKKRIPPTKPYVGFLMLYDLLKREAKALGYSKYDGYSPEFERELAETSKRSAERQLHVLLSRMLERKEIERADIITRVKGILKDLEDPRSVTSKSLIYVPTLQFVP